MAPKKGFEKAFLKEIGTAKIIGGSCADPVSKSQRLCTFLSRLISSRSSGVKFFAIFSDSR
jgi:hypothetical protein